MQRTREEQVQVHLSGEGALCANGEAEMPESESNVEADELLERGEGVQEVESRRVPKAPSPEEVRIHRLTHCPFRSWCPVRIAARGRDPPHRRRMERNLSQPQVRLDYFFPRDGQGEEYVTAVAMRAHVVPQKGDVVWATNQLHKDLLKWGIRGDITLKGDQ
eukprot:1334327-Amphidinium_carterae.1